jgi:hypothetical protein
VTEVQFYILTTVVGGGFAGLVAAVRFSGARIVRALDINSEYMLENTRSNAVLSTKIDRISDYIDGREHAARASSGS